MDLNALMGTIFSGESISGVSELTGASDSDIKNVLSSALPAILSGAQGQADNEETVSGFAGALADHAGADTSDLASFLHGVDLEDGGKILGHLLGSSKEATAQAAAEKAGLGSGQSMNILSAVAPLLMSLLGQQTQQSIPVQEDQPQQGGFQALTGASQGGGSLLSGLFGSLLGGGDTGSLISSLLGGLQ
ncbi:MAG: DUF937 domain-containing protein [Oscillospiraceae bacterium]|nr:DUF937 domain-containing protein [Oscillospiraceae bacterium]